MLSSHKTSRLLFLLNTKFASSRGGPRAEPRANVCYESPSRQMRDQL